MMLRYLALTMKSKVKGNTFRSHFDYHTHFIGYCLSKEVRKLKFETDGTFNAIYIQLGAESPYFEIHFTQSLLVGIPFDFDFYDNATQDQKYQYYLDLLHEGLQIAATHKNIPLEALNNIIQKLVDNNFIYSWDFKNLRVPEYNLKIKFTCHLSTDDFILKMVALRNKESEPICEGVVIRTKPDDIHFSYISRKIQIKNDRICLYFKSDKEIMTIGLKSILEGKLIIDFSESPYPDNPDATETFKYLQNVLKYDNYDFR